MSLRSKALIFAAAMMGATLASGPRAIAQDIRIIVVTHGQANDPFWSVVKNGVVKAAEDMKVKVDYRAPETFDMVAMAQLIDAAVNQKPTGLVVSIPDASALGPSIKKAVAAGIPVISMNSGSDVSKKLGALLHVGHDEYSTGKINVATFDLSANFLKAVAAGEAAFAIDQQQFLQGYLPVVFLANYARYGLMPGGDVPSGPNLITKDKAAQVVELSAKGIR